MAHSGQFSFLGVAAGATQPPKKKTAACACPSLATKLKQNYDLHIKNDKSFFYLITEYFGCNF